MRILAISGSLRSTSSNTAVLRAARTLAPPGIEIILYANLGALPHFNPDLDGVVRSRAQNLVGILNGVDYAVWSPEKDKLIAEKDDIRKELTATGRKIFKKFRPTSAR